MFLVEPMRSSRAACTAVMTQMTSSDQTFHRIFTKPAVNDVIAPAENHRKLQTSLGRSVDHYHFSYYLNLISDSFYNLHMVWWLFNHSVTFDLRLFEGQTWRNHNVWSGINLWTTADWGALTEERWHIRLFKITLKRKYLTQKGWESLHCPVVNVLIINRYCVPQDVDVEQHQVVACGVEHPPQGPEPQVGQLHHILQLQQHLQQHWVLPAWRGWWAGFFRVHFVQFRFVGYLLWLLIAVEKQWALWPWQAQREQQAKADKAQRNGVEGVVADLSKRHTQLPQSRAGEHAQEHRGARVPGYTLVQRRAHQGEDVGGVGHAARHSDAVEELHELHLEEAAAEEEDEPDDHLADALGDQDRFVAQEVC